jgi:copper(I)-binding protein
VANELPALSGAIRRFTAAAAIAVGSAVLVAGCAAGQSVQTVNQRPPIDGASADAGAISIRTASLASADLGGASQQGGTALLRLVIINNGPQQVQLESVSSPVAGNAQVSSTGLDQTLSALPTETGSASSSASASGSASAGSSTSAGLSTSAGGSATASGSSSGTSSSSATASPSASSATPSASESASTPANTPISIPPGQSVQVGFSSTGPTIALTGLTAQLYPAQTVPVNFTFSDGSTVNLDIPVALPSSAASAPVISDATEPTEPND